MATASCTTTTNAPKKHASKEHFSESEYGVKASPKVASNGKMPRGGGRYLVGKPYVVKGKTYYPKLNPDYEKTGLASWYGDAFHGRKTANGEVYDQYYLSAASPTMPLPSYAQVTNLDNGSSVVVRVNDRGPFHRGRIMDVSEKTAELLDMKTIGTAHVRVKYVGPARMDGHDLPYLMASYTPGPNAAPQVLPNGSVTPGVMVASNTTNLSTEFETPPPAAAVPGAVPVPLAEPDRVRVASAYLAVPTDGTTAAFDQFATLPETGPYVTERPDRFAAISPAGSLVAAYAESDAADGSDAFDAILVRDNRLTQDAIRDYARRHDQAAL
ncbi:rare lipoprotein A [Rhizobium halophytocola]|uniref:Endolytic peptidoglycan transglycosylase RlpA n=2 Tax=Rhizobium halophytocola TaxID=735519 RepID=A0ABS4DWR4_9HYPH|nr:septal ring lytic transglycosylase RlpA family protein [Rhizobium halophytocola]MBP1850134.1 rare lipoprotein A [Rhizobium halophytocola]